MSQDYQQATVYRPVVISEPIPGPLANPLSYVSPRVWRNVAISGGLAFAVTGAACGFWLCLQFTAAQIQNADNRAKLAQQAQQAAETRLQGNLAATSKFCQAALSSPPSGSSSPAPTSLAAKP